MYDRFNVQFTKKQNRALDEFAEELNTTKAGVFKMALSLLTVILREKKNGHQIGIVKKNKVIKEIIGF